MKIPVKNYLKKVKSEYVQKNVEKIILSNTYLILLFIICTDFFLI